jgi:UDP-N-acetylglucosamine 1-carboxyvinyltransferase
MAAAVANGETILENSAQEVEVDDLIHFLTKMGAKIERQGALIHIYGVGQLHGAEYTIMPDQNEVITFASMALATRGDVTIRKAEPSHLTSFLEKVTDIGGQYETQADKLRVWWEEPLQATTVVTRPYPGFKTDWQPVWTSLMTQVDGESVVHETVFEHRFTYVPLLNSMGARIELFNHDVPNPEEFYNFNLEDDRPEYFHAARIFGPTKLKGIQVAVPDIRAGATLTLAALVAEGETVLTETQHIDRGYEQLEERLRGLGADIKKDG